MFLVFWTVCGGLNITCVSVRTTYFRSRIIFPVLNVLTLLKSIAEKLNRGCSFLVNLAAELTKISGVLESALSSRTKMRAKMAPPAPERASKPKPKKNSGLTDEMMKELEELGMADDPEFIQFLINGGGGAVPQMNAPPVSHSLPTKLPGVPSPKIGINRPQARLSIVRFSETHFYLLEY